MTDLRLQKLEEVLAKRPASALFVELAKLLVASGEYGRAAQVCEEGLTHHPRSVVARVLWGKALLYLNRPAEAMEQLQQALSLDRENPHAHQWVAEVLLHKGLFRSAVPILRRAAVLAPTDHRLKQWMTAAQGALLEGTPGTFSGLTDSLGPSEVDAIDFEELDVPLAEVSRLHPVDMERTVVTAGPLTDPVHEVSEDEVEAWADETEKTDLASSGVSESEETPPSKRPLLEDVPDSSESPTIVMKIPKVELSAQAAKAIADEYERELREQLVESSYNPTFFQRNRGKVIASVLGLALVVAASAFLYTNLINRGRTLNQALADARGAILKDNEPAYRASLDYLHTAIRMDASSEEAWALAGYVHSLLFHEAGGRAQDKAQALEALDKPGVANRYPALVLASRYYLADATSKDAARKAVLESRLDTSELNELAGRILDGKRDSKRAAQRFKRAVDLSSGNARALVSFADHFRALGDCQNALAFYATAALVSPEHPQRIVGAAECRLERNEDLDESVKEMEAIPSSLELPPDLVARRILAQARLLSSTGRHEDAIKRLSEAERTFRNKKFEFAMALGDAQRSGGDFSAAQDTFQRALAERPNNEEALEALARVLIARDREKEALTRLAGAGESRKLALVRGAAYVKLGDWKRARTELSRTEVTGKFPLEAVVFLALTDAAEGQQARAQQALERALLASKKPRSFLRVALGQVYLQRGVLDKAKTQLEDASRDPTDFESLCALGRLNLQVGNLEAAVQQLRVAVARNGSHGEARHALGRALLALGKRDEALEQASDWRKENPQTVEGVRDLALALFQSGKFEEARAAISQSLSAEPSNVEAHRIYAAVLFGKGDPTAAFAALEQANRLDPKSPEIFCDIGHAFLRQGKGSAAEKAFQAALRQEPQSGCGRAGLARVKLPGEATSSVQELSALTPKVIQAWERAQMKSVLARAYLAAGALEKARLEAEEAVQLEPKMADAHLAAGLVAFKQRDDKLAKQALLRSEALDPSNAEAHLALGDLLARSGADLDRAFQEYHLFLRTTADAGERARVKRLLPTLKKRLAVR